MATDRTPGLEQELTSALEDLRTALQRAHDATAELQRIVPRVAQIGGLFEELATVINSGRQQLSTAPAAGAYSRPTLLVPSAQRQEPTPVPQMSQEDPWTQLAESWNTTTPDQERPTTADAVATTPTSPQPAVNLISFRLEFESKPGPLDLRAVDDAVSEHPAVRDVALIDYDGRKATLKVWIEDTATPAEVHTALVQKAIETFGPDNEVTVIALEDAA